MVFIICHKCLYRIFFSVIFYGLFITANAQSWNISLKSRWHNDSLNSLGGQRYNDVWGWADSVKSREYAILGSLDSIYFFDVSDPLNIKLCDAEAGRSKGCVNRDFATYKNYCYAVADEGQASLQIFDLSFLPDSVHKVYDHDSLSRNAHTIYVEKDRLYLCKNRRLNSILPMEILSLANPEIPLRIGSVSSPFINYVHDVYVKNDTAYCSCGYDGFYIYDCVNAAKPVYISSLTQYDEKGYNHSGALSEDGRYFYFTDESQGLAIKVLDLIDRKLPDLKTLFRVSKGSVAHNPYIKGHFLYLSHYHEGVRVFDISDALSPREVAWYDTYPQNSDTDFSGLRGCWGAYPWLPSGILLASDTHNGLYVLKPADNLSVSLVKSNMGLQLYPVPTSSWLRLVNHDKMKGQILIYDVSGKLVYKDEVKEYIDISQMEPGIYILKAGEFSTSFIKN